MFYVEYNTIIRLVLEKSDQFTCRKNDETKFYTNSEKHSSWFYETVTPNKFFNELIA